jgi:Acyl-CoA carboxylase epsilon subunit
MRRHDGAVGDGVLDLDGIEVVRGGAAPEELAAVLAVLAAKAEPPTTAPDGYAAWRARRLAALRCTAERPVTPWLDARRHP